MKIEDRESLLEEAIELVRFSDVNLGEEITSEEVNPLKEKAIRLLEDLNKELVEFSPKLSIYPLCQQYFNIEAHQLSPEIQGKMRDHNFYKVDIPITLKSAPDWAFSNLVCNIIFCPDEETSERMYLLPTIHDIFPADEWQDMLNLQISLTLGLDEKLFFRAEVEKMEEKWQRLGNNSQAKLAIQLAGGIKLAFGPFSYRIRKAQIKGRGRGNSKVFWEFQGAQYVNEQDVSLGIILMVPKSRKNPITAIGALEAHHDFQILNADLLHFKRFFQGTIQQFLEGGAAIQQTQVWQNITHLN